jgi:hypothetical protein
MAASFLSCNFPSSRVIFGFLKLNSMIDLADKHMQDIPMIEPIDHTGITSSPCSYTPTPSIPAQRSGSDDSRDVSKTSSKYILDGNKIVFERYDRNGKLISTVPWTTKRVTEKA